MYDKHAYIFWEGWPYRVVHTTYGYRLEIYRGGWEYLASAVTWREMLATMDRHGVSAQ